MARKAVTPKKKKANPPKRTKPTTPPAQGGDNPSAREDQFIRERTTPLTPKGNPPPAIRERGIPGGEDALEPHTADTRRDLMDEYRRRQRERQPPPPAYPREAFGPGVNVDQFSVRWSGKVEATSTGSFQFQTASNDGVRVWINGVLVINNWTNHATTTNNSAAIALTGGTCGRSCGARFCSSCSEVPVHTTSMRSSSADRRASGAVN